MSNLTKLVLFFVGLLFLQTQAADKYTDENRPYEFGFTIDGEQHRHEKKDENGIIMGEFGFITADGVYHVTVYATDENGNFKILSMKNIRVKPYPTAPGTGVKKSNSITSIAQKVSIPESTKEEKTIKKQIASPAKSCSHCSLPTTTTKATPVLSKVPEKLRNNQYTETYNENGHKFNNNNRLSSKNLGDQQKQNISKTKQSYTQAVSQNYQQKQPSNRNSQNENLSSSQNLGYQHPNVKPITTQYPKTIDNKKSLQQNAVPHNPLQINDQNGEQYFVPQNNPLNAEQQISVPGVRQNNPAVTIAGSRYPQSNPESISAVPHKPVQINTHNGEQYFVPQNNPLNAKQQISVPGVRQNNPTVTITGSRYPQSNAESISRTLKGPINKENYPTNLALPQNNQEKNGFKNDNQNDLKNNNYKYTEVQQQKKYDQYGQMNQPNQLLISLPPIVTSRQSLQPQSEKSILENPKGERSPKSFADFIQQSEGPEELASTGPNLYRPSLPKASEFSGKPVLLAAQMQKVDKKTDIYNKNPGESNGLPEGITLDDVKNLLYTFNYTVGFHGHHEKGYSNGVKQGYYYVTGRNGVKTRVDYIADENGFQPKITQEILNVVSDEVPKPETEKDEKYGLKGYEFKWLYFPLDSQSA